MYLDVPFVDRNEAISHLRNTREESQTGVQFICGRSGLGKSELARKFAEECEENGNQTLFYEIGEPRNEKVFLQRLLGAWYEKHPESTAAQLKEYLLSPDSVDDFLGLIERAVPEPSSSLGIKGLRKAVSRSAGESANFPDPVRLVIEVLKAHGNQDSPAVVIIDQYDMGNSESEGELGSTFRDIANHCDESVVWYVTSNAEIQDGTRVDCYHLEPFDQNTNANFGASYPEDRGSEGSRNSEINQAYQATKTLVDKSGLEYEESDIVDLHDRTKGIPLLVASICEQPDSFSLREELDNKPTTYDKFKTQVQQDFIRELTDRQLELLEKTSPLLVLTEQICSKRTGISGPNIHQEFISLSEQGKIKRISSDYPISPAYRYHDFYRGLLIESSDLGERELRLETAIDCLEVALNNVQMAREPEMDDTVAIEVHRFLNQIAEVKEYKSIPEITDLLLKGINNTEEEVVELFALYCGSGHRESTFEDYVRVAL
jgi:hypothetical protein